MTDDQGRSGAARAEAILQWVCPAPGRSRPASSPIVLSRLQGHLSVRAQGLDRAHVNVLVQCAEPLPAIVVHKDSMRVIDGMHRLRVAQLRGQDEIDVALFEGSEAEAFALSAVLNVCHGLPLPIADRRSAAARIIATNPEWSDRFVSSLVGLSHKTIAKIRRCSTGESHQVNRRVGRDGKVRPPDPVLGRLRAAELLADDPELSLRQLARAADVSVSTARDVRLRVRCGEDPVPDRLRRSRSSTQTVTDASQVTTDKHPHHEDQAEPPREKDLPGEAPQADHTPVPFDLALERLKRDPAVRFNDAGRNLVRQFLAAHLAVARCRQVLPAAPAHCLATVADLAQAQAAAWQQLAALADATAETKQAL